VPDGALPDIDPDAVSTGPMTAGTILTTPDVTRPGEIGDGTAALAFPRSPTTPPVGVGTPVVLVVNGDPLLGLKARVIDGRVADVTDDQVVVAVDRADVVDASAALSTGTATLALAG
jgi:hypothetical protein